MTYILTNFFPQNKTFYFFGAVDFFFISAQHMSSNRNFGVKQIFWADEFQADYSNKPNRQLRLVTPLFLTATIT